jgi:two-component system, OmpR family, sensor histidine kinase MprB
VSLRARMVLAVSAAVAAAVVLASLIVFFVVRNELYSGIDHNLQNQVDQISHTPGLELATPIGPKAYALHVRLPALGTNPFQLVDNAGATYRPYFGGFDGGYADLLPGVSMARQVATGARGQSYLDSRYQDEHVRLYVTQLSPNLSLEVVASLSSVDHELSRIKLWLIVVAIGGVAVAAIAGFLVARAALSPVRELSDTAEHVRSTRDLSQRIRIDGSDELSRLAATFNAMLQSLDEAARLQRRLVQDASHELRTPLTSLRTNIELLATRGHDLPPDERDHLLRDVVEQLGEMTVLIGELTELARGEERQHAAEEVRLDLVAEDAIRRATRNHPEVPIVARLDPTTVVGVPASLERAIGNLLENAAKWSPDGAEIDVQLTGGELTVRDHGPGIADADLPHVFERFYRATSARGMPGSGLGLAIVRQVAEAHGGTVTAEHAPGGGTLMRLRVAHRNGAGR